MKISVVIPAYNEEAYIGNTLRTLTDSTTQDLLEIIVVNNASTDKTVEVASRFSGVQIVNEPHKGLTRARQAGLNASKGDLLAFIDADSLVPKDWLKVISKEFSKDRALVFLSGPYIYYDTPAWQRWVVKWLYYGLLARTVYFFTSYMGTGGNMVARKESLIKVGGFNTSIEFFGEDTDIARRLSKIGRVKFKWDFVMRTSGRRLVSEGTLRTATRYAMNFGSVMLFKKPISTKYRDIR